MTTFETSKIIAGIGSLILGSIVGIILFMLGMKGLSEHYKDRRIYDGLITGGILLIVSWIMFFVGLALIRILIGIPIIIVAFILALLSVRYIRNCFSVLAERSGEKLFNTAGTLIWVGAFLSIILVGFIIIWIGFIVAGIGFLTLNTAPQQTQCYVPPQSQNTQQSTPSSAYNSTANFCPNCGAPVAPNVTFCSTCGKQI
jgi:uncharacterized membrane protein